MPRRGPTPSFIRILATVEARIPASVHCPAIGGGAELVRVSVTGPSPTPKARFAQPPKSTTPCVFFPFFPFLFPFPPSRSTILSSVCRVGPKVAFELVLLGEPVNRPNAPLRARQRQSPVPEGATTRSHRPTTYGRRIRKATSGPGWGSPCPKKAISWRHGPSSLRDGSACHEHLPQTGTLSLIDRLEDSQEGSPPRPLSEKRKTQLGRTDIPPSCPLEDCQIRGSLLEAADFHFGTNERSAFQQINSIVFPIRLCEAGEELR